MIKYLAITLFMPFACAASAETSNSDSFHCEKGKVKIGNSYEEYKKICGEHKGPQESGYSQNKDIKSFRTFVKKYPDKSEVRFLFINKKLAFIFS
jgi:hypothetical protein